MRRGVTKVTKVANFPFLSSNMNNIQTITSYIKEAFKNNKQNIGKKQRENKKIIDLETKNVVPE